VIGYGQEPIEITRTTTELPPYEILIGCGEASYGLGNRFVIDWDRFYETLEMYGWDMQDLGGPVDNKIQRIVRKAVREGEIS